MLKPENIRGPSWGAPKLHIRCFQHVKRPPGRGIGVVKGYRTPQGRSSDSLDAFYVGRAIAEVLRESLGSGLLELLSELARRDAILRKELRDFQEAVLARVNDQVPEARSSLESLRQSQNRPESSSNVNTSLRPSYGSRRRNERQIITADIPLDQLEHGSLLALQEAVDDLRAEVAFARSVLQAYKRTTVQGILEARYINKGSVESKIGRFRTSGIGLGRRS